MRLLQFLVLWGPIILFSLILLSGFLMGVLRGLRRSRVFLIHRLIAGSIALTLFFLCVGSTFFDKAFLSLFNVFGIDLHEFFDVSTSIDTLKGVLTAGIPSLIKESDAALAIALAENSRYMLAFIYLVYNLIFGVICLIIYYLIKAILFLCYCLFYPEWKYRRKYKNKVSKNENAKPYKTRRLAGGLIGLCSSFLVAIISFSFIGNLMYIAVGTGDKGLPNQKFSDSNTNEAYSVVNTIESYGTKGIFKVLNLAKDKDGVPLYLYPAGVFFSGKLEDETTNETERIYFTYEMGNYTAFLRDTASLAIEYCGDDIDKTISGDEVEISNLVKDLLTNDVFRLKFRELLAEYTDKSTFVNEFMFDLLDSYCANIDKSSLADSLSEDAVELMEILFVKGYISPVIYFEEKYIESGKELPYVKVSDIVTKKDLLVVYDIFTDLVDKGLLDEEYDVVDLVISATSHLEQLKVFNLTNANKSNINGVLGRLYSYAEIKLLGVSSTESIEKYTTNIDVKWTDEIVALANKAPDIQVVYNKVKQLQDNGATTRECFEGLFDDSNVLQAYDSVVDYVGNSLLVGRVVDSSYVFGALEELIVQNASGYTRPKDLNFTNYVDDNGNIVHGELFNYLQVIRQFGTNVDTREIIINAIDGGEEDILQQLKIAEDDMMESDVYGNSIVDYLKKSTLLRSVGSAYIINASKQDSVPVYVPNISKEKDAEGSYVDIIKQDEFNLIIDSLFTQNNSTDSKDFGIISLIPDGVRLDDANFKNSIFENNDNLFENNVINNLINNSAIIQATFGNFIVKNTDSLGDIVVVSSSLSQPSSWVAEYKVENNQKVLVKQSETVKVFDALHELFETSKKLKDIDSAFNDILKTNKLSQLNYPATKVTSIFVDGEGTKENVTKTEVLYNSILISGTISNYICNNVPEDLKTEGIEKAKGEDGIITIEEFSAIIELLNFLDIDDVTSQDSFNVLDDYMNNLSGVITDTEYGRENEKNAILLDLVYDSNIVKYYFSKVVDDALCVAIGELDVDKVKLDYIKDDGIYSYQQSREIVESLVVCDVDCAENSSNKVVEAFQHFNDTIYHEDYPAVIREGESSTRLDVFYKSSAMVILLTDSLEEQIAENNKLQDHPDAKEKIVCGENSYYQYKKYEIMQLVNFIDGKSIDGTSADQFDASHINIQRVRDEFFDSNTKLCNSKLLLSCISLNLIENEAVTNGVLLIPTTALVDMTDFMLVVDAELYNVLSFACDLGVSDMSSVNNTMNDDSQLKLSVVNAYVAEGIQNTDIIRATVSDKIINNDALSIPKDVIDLSYEDYKVINAREMSTLFTLVEQVGIVDMTGVKDLDMDEITLTNAKSWIEQSRIIHATTSQKIIENCSDDTAYLIIPVKAKIYDNGDYVDSIIVTYDTISAKNDLDTLTMISLEELTYLFDALIMINVDTIANTHALTENDFNPANYSDAQINSFAESSILRATITQNVRFIGENQDIIPKALTTEVDHGDGYLDTKTNQNKIGILHDHEVIHLLIAIRKFKQYNDTGSAFTCKFTTSELIELYSSGSLVTILESDIFRVAISDFFIKQDISITTTNVSCYCFDVKTDAVFPVSSAQDILNYFASLPI